MRLCSLTTSQFLFLLLVSVARCRPFKNHEFTYTEGLNILTGGPTNFINIKFATVLNCNEALVGVPIKFICEKPRSHSLVEIGILLIAFKRGIRDDGIFFSERYSRKPLRICLSVSPNLLHKFIISVSPKVKGGLSGQVLQSSTLAYCGISEFSLAKSWLSIRAFRLS